MEVQLFFGRGFHGATHQRRCALRCRTPISIPPAGHQSWATTLRFWRLVTWLAPCFRTTRRGRYASDADLGEHLTGPSLEAAFQNTSMTDAESRCFVAPQAVFQSVWCGRLARVCWKQKKISADATQFPAVSGSRCVEELFRREIWVLLLIGQSWRGSLLDVVREAA
jgi:hypothetical protein